MGGWVIGFYRYNYRDRDSTPRKEPKQSNPRPNLNHIPSSNPISTGYLHIMIKVMGRQKKNTCVKHSLLLLGCLLVSVGKETC